MSRIVSILVLLGLCQVARPAVVAAADEIVAVPRELVDLIGELLPEQSSAGAAFVSEVYSPNLRFTAQATVDITFIWEGAGYRNTLGYFTYTENADGSTTVHDADLLIRDASFPVVQTGLRRYLLGPDGKPRLFEPGERVGFFVIADGWSTVPAVRSWKYATPGIPAADGGKNRTIGRGLYTTLNRINPEFADLKPDAARHVAMIKLDGQPGFLEGEPFFLTGFEDLNRAGGSDNDFNDLVFVTHATPITAVEATEVLRYTPGDPDGDGIEGTLDAYPNDGSRAFRNRYPAAGHNQLALEDHYPVPGDADFNDAVIAYAYEVVSSAKGDVTDILGTFHLVARGAAFDHRFGLHLPGVPEMARGEVRIERFLGGDTAKHQVEPARGLEEVIELDQRRIPDIFPSTRAALPPVAGAEVSNTQSIEPENDAASARVHIRLDTPVPAAVLGSLPYDLYFSVIHAGHERDVHRVGVAGFTDRPRWLPVESGSGAFIDADGFPFVMEVPLGWRFPLERVGIAAAYPAFTSWRTSKGAKDRDWFLRPTTSAKRVASSIADNVPVRDWSVQLPTP